MSKLFYNVMIMLLIGFVTPVRADTLADFSWTSLSDPTKMDALEKMVFGHIFGTFVFSQGGDYSALSLVLGLLNYLAMLVGVIIVSYSFFAGSVNTAADGKLLGEKWSSVWLPIRTATGFGFLTPALSGTSTISIAQMLMLKLILVGSSAGTLVWQTAVDQVVSYNNPIAASAPAPNLMQVVDIAGSAICANNEWYRLNGGAGASNPRPLYTLKSQDAAGKVTTLEYRGALTDTPYALPSGSIVQTIDFGDSGLCGSMSIFTGDASENSDATNKAYAAASQVLIDNLNYYNAFEITGRQGGLNTATLEMVYDGSAYLDSDKYRPQIERLRQLVIDQAGSYQPELYNGVINAFKSSVNADKDKKELLSYNSWMMAGLASIRLANYSSAPNNVMQVINTGLQNGSWRACAEGSDDCRVPSKSNASMIRGGIRSESTMGLMKIVYGALGSGQVKLIANATATSGEIECKENGCSAVSLINKPTNEINRVVLDSLVKFGQYTSDNPTDGATPSTFDFFGGSNPFYVTAMMGHSLLTVAQATWAAGLAAVVVSHAVGGSVVGLVGGAGASGGVDYVVATLAPLLGAVLMAGGVMAYVIPTLIVIRWIWAVGNYLLITVEAMSAAPLAVVMMVTPEGDGIAGSRAERSIMLLFQVVLWPVFLIISLISVLTLSALFFSMLNIAWFTDTAGFNNAGIFDTVVRLLLYVSFLTSLNMSCAAFVDVLPNAVFGWLGGGISTSLQNNAGERAEGATKAAEGVLQQSMSKGMSKMRENLAAKQRRDFYAAQAKDD
jgi:conjugal transfer/type IV secretion protein DotA/TraY